ncbi:hypothetical protein WAE61_11460 [Comamonadaceae bacterium PP-2]
MSAWLWGTLAAVLLCWATGAYNRLVRLRAAVSGGFASVAETSQRLSGVVHAALDLEAAAAARVSDAALQTEEALQAEPSEPGARDGQGSPVPAVAEARPAGPATLSAEAQLLRGALMQYVAALAVVQSRPLSNEAVGAFNAAQAVLLEVWASREQAVLPAPGGAADALADDGLGVGYQVLASQWQQAQAQHRLTTEKFNDLVHGYNEAVRQFPAVIMAWAASFRPVPLVELPKALTTPISSL